MSPSRTLTTKAFIAMLPKMAENLGEKTHRLKNTNNLKFPPEFSMKKPDILRQLSMQVVGSDKKSTTDV